MDGGVAREEFPKTAQLDTGIVDELLDFAWSGA